MQKSLLNTPLVAPTSALTQTLSPQEAGRLLGKLFPTVDCPIKPFGAGILVQIASALDKIGSIHLTEETQDFQKWTQKLALVVKVGPLAFKDRVTMEPWPEGAWAQPGDYVRVRQYTGDRVEVIADSGQVALFAIVPDRELVSGMEDGFNPLTCRGWV